MPTRARERENSRVKETFLFVGMADVTMMGIGNTTKRRSVIMSQVPIVISCA
jgi:hypothetical protein